MMFGGRGMPVAVSTLGDDDHSLIEGLADGWTATGVTASMVG
jgi:hypothetical protein